MKTTCKTLEQLEQTINDQPEHGFVGTTGLRRAQSSRGRPELTQGPYARQICVEPLGTAKTRADTWVRPYDGHRVNAANHPWLTRNGLLKLVCGMMELSASYDLPWAASWQHHLDDPEWIGKAMAQTFTRLTPEDKDTVRALYDDWLWFENNVDMQALVEPEYNALCYLLDAKGIRVCNVQGPVTILRGLKGRDKQEALKTLDKRCYEFKQWW